MVKRTVILNGLRPRVTVGVLYCPPMQCLRLDGVCLSVKAAGAAALLFRKHNCEGNDYRGRACKSRTLRLQDKTRLRRMTSCRKGACWPESGGEHGLALFITSHSPLSWRDRHAGASRIMDRDCRAMTPQCLVGEMRASESCPWFVLLTSSQCLATAVRQWFMWCKHKTFVTVVQQWLAAANRLDAFQTRPDDWLNSITIARALTWASS
jgi:hypothetical protein